MNLGYKRMGLRAGIVAFAGGIKIAVILLGYGLVGLAAVQVLVSVITGYSFYYIVKKHVPWFGFGKPNWSNVKSFGKVSLWFMVFTTVKTLLVNSDKVILGYFVGPVLVAKYALTMFTSTTIQGAAVSVISGITPGICSLLGSGDFNKVSRARRIVMSFIWLLAVSAGVTILMLNRSFIHLWIGKNNYAGNLENLLILLITVQFIFFQLDSSIINVGLNKKKKAALSIAATVLTLLFSWALVLKYQILGLCISMLLGRMVFTLGFPILLRQQTKSSSSFFSFDLMYPFIVSLLLFLTATWAGDLINVNGWIQLLIYGVAIFAGSGFLFWNVGIKRSDRKEVLGVLGNIKLLKMN
jgi:O-antigen/teichoic acid export membrane protein